MPAIPKPKCNCGWTTKTEMEFVMQVKDDSPKYKDRTYPNLWQCPKCKTIKLD